MSGWLARIFQRRIGVIVIPAILALFRDRLGIDIPKELFDQVLVAVAGLVPPLLALLTLMKSADTRSSGTKIAGAIIPATALVLAQFGVVVPEELQESLALKAGLLFEAALMAWSAARPRTMPVKLAPLPPAAAVLLALGLGFATTSHGQAAVAVVSIGALTTTAQPVVAAALASDVTILAFSVSGGAAAEEVIFRAIDDSPEYFRQPVAIGQVLTLPGLVVGAEGLEVITATAAGDVRVNAFVGPKQ